MKTTPSILGGACIIASVCVGAGMLGLPSSGAGAWTLWSVLALVVTMIMMTLSGWMLLEAFQHYEMRASFNTVAKDLLGSRLNAFNNLSVYFVGGILLYAYITSSGAILQGLTGLDSKLASILFVAVFSFVVWHSTRAVDRISVVLIAFMVLSFAFGVLGLLGNINLVTLFDLDGKESHYAPYAMAMLPVALTSFGYHHSVASLRAYYQNEQQAKWAMLGGTVIALALYVLWLVGIFGNLPRQEFAPVIAQGGEVSALLSALSGVIESEKVASAINGFSMAAILSSFIGVGLGVFDYLADFFKFADSRSGRCKTWAVTFLPPLALSLLFPFGFLLAIGYAGAAATIWTCIVPALLVLRARARATNGEVHPRFTTPGGRVMAYLLILFGLATALFHFMAMANLLPVYAGHGG
ncbi:aromatic amino acid transporter [Aeromonas cavernicola]|uniref:Aromatic amino acid permease n=1 Tax=Aeromonas cavernicola TaxID=1006623 RepID=A0A2H9U142_9GAMM|nr:aromatic amino acid transporter [Aeromonas cavernicola]PJG57776.1 transposase [Aeromonas cavernicola]